MNALKILAIVLVLCLGLTACGGTAPEETTEGTIPTVTNATQDTTPADDGLTTYTVKIQDEAGAPIAGAMVQLCKEACVPGVADETGVAVFRLEEADYEVKFLQLPAGYTYTTEEQVFYFEAGSYELTIVLKAEA